MTDYALALLVSFAPVAIVFGAMAVAYEALGLAWRAQRRLRGLR